MQRCSIISDQVFVKQLGIHILVYKMCWLTCITAKNSCASSKGKQIYSLILMTIALTS